MKKFLRTILSVTLCLLFVLQTLPASAIGEIVGGIDKPIKNDEKIKELEEEALSPILFEDESLREENVKHFRLENGSYIAATYSSPIHYEEDGMWKEIDNTLSLKEGLYQAENGAVKVALPAQLGTDKEIKLSYNEYSVKISYVPTDTLGQIISADTIGDKANVENPKEDNIAAFDKTKIENADKGEAKEAINKYNDEKMAADKTVSRVGYDHVKEGTCLEYIVTSTGIKENIVVAAPQAEYKYVFKLDAGKLELAQNKDGSISLHAPGAPEEVVFIIGAPYMADANGEISYDVTMEVSSLLTHQTNPGIDERSTPAVDMEDDDLKDVGMPEASAEQTIVSEEEAVSGIAGGIEEQKTNRFILPL